MSCTNTRYLPLPFVSPRSKRSRVFRVPQAAAQNNSRGILPSLGGVLLTTPAWADEIASELQKKDLPSSLPSVEEVTRKAPQAGDILDLFTDNPILIAGVLFLAAIPIALNFLGGGALGVKQISAVGALEGLSSDPTTVLIDIRSREDAKQQGAPNLSSVKRKAIALPFTRTMQGAVEEIDNFTEKFSQLRQIKADSSIIILDAYGKEAPKAAKRLAKLVGKVYYVQGGANGWKESGQPWREPGKSLLNLEGIADDFKSQPTFAKAGVAVGAVGVAAAVLFQEAGTVIELAAVAAAGALALPNFLKSKDGGTTKRQVKQFVEDSERQVSKAAGQAKSQAQQTGERISDEAGRKSQTELGAEAQGVANKVQSTVEKPGESLKKAERAAEKTAEKVGSEVESAASEAANSAEGNAKEASKWIEDWKKENSKS